MEVEDSCWANTRRRRLGDGMTDSRVSVFATRTRLVEPWEAAIIIRKKGRHRRHTPVRLYKANQGHGGTLGFWGPEYFDTFKD